MMKDEYDNGNEEENSMEKRDRDIDSRTDRLRTFTESSQAYNNMNQSR